MIGWLISHHSIVCLQFAFTLIKTTISAGRVPSSWENGLNPLVPADVAAKYIVNGMGRRIGSTTVGARMYTSLPISTLVSNSTIIDWACELSPKPIVRGVAPSEGVMALQEAIDPQEAFITQLITLMDACSRSMDRVAAKIRNTSSINATKMMLRSRARISSKRVEELLLWYIKDNPHVVLDKAIVGEQEDTTTALASKQ